jgi:predicted unusual protein kinase regulating ubiquinone biosynthesis (AarF/ABC1/UbiB family)
MARLYGDREDVVVPGIMWEYTSPRVITMVGRCRLTPG